MGFLRDLYGELGHLDPETRALLQPYSTTEQGRGSLGALGADVLTLPGRSLSGIGGAIGAALNQVLPGQTPMPGGFLQNVGQGFGEGIATTVDDDPTIVGSLIKDPVAVPFALTGGLMGGAMRAGGGLAKSVASPVLRKTLSLAGSGLGGGAAAEGVQLGTDIATGADLSLDGIAEDAAFNLAFGLGGEGAIAGGKAAIGGLKRVVLGSPEARESRRRLLQAVMTTGMAGVPGLGGLGVKAPGIPSNAASAKPLKVIPGKRASSDLEELFDDGLQRSTSAGAWTSKPSDDLLQNIAAAEKKLKR